MSLRSAYSGRGSRSARRRSATGWSWPRPARSRSRPAPRGRSWAGSPRPWWRPACGIRPARPRPPRARRHPCPRRRIPSAGRCAGRPAAAPGRGRNPRRALERGRIARVEAGHGVQQQRAVFGALGHRPGLVEAGGEGDHAVARDHAVGRLEAGEAAQGRRLADRAAGVGAGGGRRQACGDRRGRAARGAAGHAGRCPRGSSPGRKRGFVGRAHGELVHVELAQRDHAGGGESSTTWAS
jgi:hypothetical protein